MIESEEPDAEQDEVQQRLAQQPAGIERHFARYSATARPMAQDLRAVEPFLRHSPPVHRGEARAGHGSREGAWSVITVSHDRRPACAIHADEL
jgi:hypothetical protein